MIVRFIIFILFLSTTVKVPYEGTRCYCCRLADKEAEAQGGEEICLKLLNRPVGVKHAENRFPMHGLKALFLRIQCLPFAYGDTKFQDLQSQTITIMGICMLFERSSCSGTFRVLKNTTVDRFFRPAALLVS